MVLAAIQTALTTGVVLLLGLPYGFLIVAASALAMLIPRSDGTNAHGL